MTKFNPRITWDALDEDEKRQIGEAALLLELSTQHAKLETLPLALVRKWERAEQIAWDLLEESVAANVQEFPDGPDLAAIGISACRICGCTDERACAGGCSWVEPGLCSSCGQLVTVDGGEPLALADFFEINRDGINRAEQDAIRETLAKGRAYAGGGGAAAAWSIRKVSP